MTITEKVAYIKGLIKGLALDEKDPQNQVILAIADVLEDIAVTVSDNDERVEYLEGYCDELDDDLAELEDVVYDDVDDEDDECYGCPGCDGDVDDDDEEETICVECPNCGEVVYLDEDCDLDHIICDNCKEEFSCKLPDED